MFMWIELILIQVVAFAALILGLRWIFYRQLNTALKRLKVLHDEALAKEAQLRDQLEKAQKERAEEVEKGRQEAKTLVEMAKRQIQVQQVQMEQKAKEEAERILLQRKEELEKLQANLSKEIQNQAIEVATQIVKYLFTANGKESLQHQFIQEVLQEIDQLEKERFSVKTTEVKISSSLPLSDLERDQLKKVLSEKTDRSVQLRESVDPQLICGMVIEMDAMVIDGSFKNRLRKLIPRMRS